MADLHDSLNTAGSHATSENSAGRQEFFAKDGDSNVSPVFSANERPLMISAWNLGDGVAVLQKVHVRCEQVVEAEDVKIMGRPITLEGEGAVSVIPLAGQYRFRLDGGDPQTARVQWTNMQMPFVDALTAFVNGVDPS